MQRVLVLGGGGFIGRRVVTAIADSGWARPVVVSRHAVAAAGDVEHVRGDATDETTLTRLLTDADGVVNCVTGEDAVIVANAKALCAAALESPRQPRIVYLSSMAVYGHEGDLVEENAGLDSSLAGYAGAKIAAENRLAGYPNRVVLRPGIVFGPHSDWWSLQIGRLLCQRRLGDLGQQGQGICNLLYVEDMARAALEALRRPEVAGATFNLAMSQAPTWNEYFLQYGHALGVTPPTRISATRLAAELRVVGPALKALELAGAKLGFRTPPPIRPWLTQLTQEPLRLAVAAAERRLNMRWTPLQTGLAATATWFRDLFPPPRA